MRWLFVLGFQAAVFTALALWVAGHPGQASITWLGWQLDAPVGHLLGLLGVGLIMVVFAVQLLIDVYRAPRRLQRAWRQERRARGHRMFLQGLQAWTAGDKKMLRKSADHMRSLLPSCAQTHFLAAQAATLEGDPEKAKTCFAKLSTFPESAFWGFLGLSEHAESRAAAMKLLQEARTYYPTAPRAVFRLAHLQAQTGDFAGAARQLSGVSAKELPDPNLPAVLAAGEAMQALEQKNPRLALRSARRAFSANPGWLPAHLLLARSLLETKRFAACARAVRRSWLLFPHPRLARIFVAASTKGQSSDSLQVVMYIKRLVHGKEQAPESRLILGEALLDARLWGEARRVLESCLQDPQTPKGKRLYRLLIRLEESTTEDAVAVRKWLDLAINSCDQDFVWRCLHCSQTTEDWMVFCPRCGAMGNLAWDKPASDKQDAVTSAYSVFAPVRSPDRLLEKASSG